MAKTAKKAARLPSGKYGWRGRAVPFGKLPKREQARFRSGWAKKAAKTTRGKARAVEKILGRKPKQADKVWIGTKEGERGGRVFSANVGKRLVLAVVKWIRARQVADMPEATRGTWSVHLEWPDDPRSGASPYITFAGFEPVRLGRGLSEKDRDFARYVEEIRATNGAQLDRMQRVSSGASGKVRVRSIHLLAW